MKYIAILLFLAASFAQAHIVNCDDAQNPEECKKLMAELYPLDEHHNPKAKDFAPEVEPQETQEVVVDIPVPAVSFPVFQASKEVEVKVEVPTTTPCVNKENSKYSIDFDEDTITITYGKKGLIHLIVYYKGVDNREYDFCRVMMGYVGFEKYYNDITLGELQDIIVDYRQPQVKRTCVKVVRDIITPKNLKLALQVNGCIVARYPEEVPKSPSLTRKPKLAIMWASLKK